MSEESVRGHGECGTEAEDDPALAAVDTPASHAALSRWRERGDDRFDPVRFRFLEALARRAATQADAVRRIVDARLAVRIASYGEDLERARGAAAPETASATATAPSAALPARPERSELAALVDRLGAAHAGGGHEAREAEAPKALSQLRATWSRLSADRRLTQALANLPDNAGPLNSQVLVHRALARMREISPAYLHRFMAQVDTLLWLDQADGAGGSAAISAASAMGTVGSVTAASNSHHAGVAPSATGASTTTPAAAVANKKPSAGPRRKSSRARPAGA